MLNFQYIVGKILLDEQVKKIILCKIFYGLYICGVKDGDEVNGFIVSWVM